MMVNKKLNSFLHTRGIRAAAVLALIATTVGAAGAAPQPVPNPTQPARNTVEVISPNSPPAQAPGIAELVQQTRAQAPFTLQHRPPAVLLAAANPTNGQDAVQQARNCAPGVPNLPSRLPLSERNVDAVKISWQCLVAIEQKEAAFNNVLSINTNSEPQDLNSLEMAATATVAVHPTYKTIAEQPRGNVPAPVLAAAQAAQAANRPPQNAPPEQQPVFTALVPEGVGCPSHQEEVFEIRADKSVVEAELLVQEYIAENCR